MRTAMTNTDREQLKKIFNREAYEFTNEWFLGNVYGRGLEVNISDIWEKLFAQYTIKSILEIGSYEGQSTTYLCEHFGKLNGADITCVDTWGGSFEHSSHNMSEVEKRFDKNIQIATDNYPSVKVRKLKTDSVNACSQLIVEGYRSHFDLIYIDGSHKACDVLSDALLTYHLAKEGALIIFDDYLWNYGFRKTGNVLATPKIGVDAFVNTFADKVEIIHGLPSYQLYIKKLN
jgi:predicted O-methyltransferase YrrM